MLQAMAGAGPEAPFGSSIRGRDFPAAAAAGIARGLRVAYAPDPAGIGIDADIERLCRDAAFGLGDAGAVVGEEDLDLAFVRPAFLSLRGLWFVTQLRAHLPQRDRFGPNVANNVRAGLETTVEQLADAEQARGRAVAPVSRTVRARRLRGHAVHGGAAVSGHRQLPADRGRPADGDLRGLDRADVRVEHDRPAGGGCSRRTRCARPAGGPADRRSAARRRAGPGRGRRDRALAAHRGTEHSRSPPVPGQPG